MAPIPTSLPSSSGSDAVPVAVRQRFFLATSSSVLSSSSSLFSAVVVGSTATGMMGYVLAQTLGAVMRVNQRRASISSTKESSPLDKPPLSDNDSPSTLPSNDDDDNNNDNKNDESPLPSPSSPLAEGLPSILVRLVVGTTLYGEPWRMLSNLTTAKGRKNSNGTINNNNNNHNNNTTETTLLMAAAVLGMVWTYNAMIVGTHTTRNGQNATPPYTFTQLLPRRHDVAVVLGLLACPPEWRSRGAAAWMGLAVYDGLASLVPSEEPSSSSAGSAPLNPPPMGRRPPTPPPTPSAAVPVVVDPPRTVRASNHPQQQVLSRTIDSSTLAPPLHGSVPAFQHQQHYDSALSLLDAATTTSSSPPPPVATVVSQEALSPSLQRLVPPLPHSMVVESLDRTRGAITTTANNNSNNTAATAPTRYLEMLVHNVSHTDLILSLNAPTTTTSNDHHDHVPTTTPNPADPHCLCRPRFSFFDHYCRAVLERLSGREEILAFPRYQRSIEDPRYSIAKSTGLVTPTGLALLASNHVDTKNDDPNVLWADLTDVRVRGRDHCRLGEGNSLFHRHHDDHSFPANDSTNPDRDESPLDPASHGTTNGSNPASPQGEGLSSLLTSPPQRRFPVSHVFFPLLAALMPRWESQISDKRYRHRQHVKRVLVLVSGVGTPRNFTHSPKGNSTEACADLMQHFLQQIDPTLTVVKVHSETNIFRYDENLAFVHDELMPVLDSYRDAHARGLPYPDEVSATTTSAPTVVPQRFDVDWRKTVSVTLSFADGSPARTYAIQASLRPYRPTFFHFWQLKTFWHESKIVDDDIEVYSFEAMETSPAVDVGRLTDPNLAMVVDEMKRFRHEMLATLNSGQNDIKKFWLRKTHKPVLAILLVQTADMKEPKLYRGTNMEVSMPTGSLCAERNVIGSALADNPGLKREDLKIVAVLAVVPPAMEDLEQILAAADGNGGGGGAGAGGGDTTNGVHGGNGVGVMAGGGGNHQRRRANSVASYGSVTLASTMAAVVDPGAGGASTATSNNNSHHAFSRDRKISIGSETDEWMAASGHGLPDQVPVVQETLGFSDSALPPLSGGNNNNHTNGDESVSTPIRKIALFGNSTGGFSRKPKRTVVVQSSRDLNPLRPCGACNEWLKKIAECNPYFQIVTFTDGDCQGVYCAPCQE